MHLTRATNYAVRALVEMSRRGGLARSALAPLAEEMGAPPAFLAKVLQRLKRAGIMEGIRGPGGGYRLARPGEGITVRDVVEAVEGRTSLAKCLSTGESCPRKRGCSARRLWSRLEERVNQALEAETIATVAAED